jgi:acetolactate synthase-1/3 small subunit|tara:strand:- start:667 stop:1227 length:561 start_codon:yes stop_codon:yes gene_type:complete
VKQTIITYVKDEPGVLNRIASHFYRLNYNIESIAAGRSEVRGITRLTIVCNHTDDYNQSLIKNHLEDLDTVLDVIDISNVPSVLREHALVKLKPGKKGMSLLNDLVSEKGAKIIDNDNSICIVEATGEVEEVENLIKKLKQFEILEIMRSGKVAMVKVDQDEHRVEIEEMKRQKGWTTQQISDALY